MRTQTSTLMTKEVQAIIAAAAAARLGKGSERNSSKCVVALNAINGAQKPASPSIEAGMDQSVCGFDEQNYWSFHGSNRAKGLTGRLQH